MYAGDANQNRAPDGTVVNFVASAGQIKSSCTLVEGGCSVIWRTVFPLPGSHINDGRVLQTTDIRHPEINNGAIYNPAWKGNPAGIASVIAYTSGSASFFDGNGNGFYDGVVDTPVVVHYPEAYLDVNLNGKFDPDTMDNPRENFIDYDKDGEFDQAPDYFQGFTCSDAVIASGNGDCSEQMHVRDSATVTFASGDVYLKIEIRSGDRLILRTDELGDPDDNYDCRLGRFDTSRRNIVYRVEFSDVNGNGVAPGTSMSLEAPEGFEVESSIETDTTYDIKPVLLASPRRTDDEPITRPDQMMVEFTCVRNFERSFPIGPQLYGSIPDDENNNNEVTIENCKYDPQG